MERFFQAVRFTYIQAIGFPALVLFVFFAASPSASAASAASASYTIFHRTIDGGGRRAATAHYTADISLGGLGGVSQITALGVTARIGYAGQLNDSPTLTAIADRVIVTGTAIGTIAFTVSDLETPVDQLIVQAQSSNPTLAPQQNIVLDGSGSNRTVMVTPAAGQLGSAVITLTATDEVGLVGRSAFRLTVVAVNGPPTIAPVLDQVTLEDTATGAIGFRVTDTETPPGDLVVSGTSSNPTLVPVPNIVFGGSGSNRTVVITPASQENGSAVISLVVVDQFGANASRSFRLNVTPVNDAPGFQLRTNVLTVLEDAGLTNVTGFAIDLSAGPPNETGQSLNFTVTTRSNGFFAIPPVITPAGVLAFKPGLDAHGTNEVTVVLRDSGGSANGGVNQSAARTFKLVVLPVTEPPRILPMASRTLLEDSATNILFTVQNPDGAIGDVTVTARSSNPSLIVSAGLVVSGNGTTRTLNLQPQPNANGVAAITLVASAPGLGSRTNSFVLTVLAVNDAPGFNLSRTSLVVARNGGMTNVPAWLTGLTKGPPNEAAQGLSLVVTNSNPSLFAAPPTITSIGTLSFQPATHATGVATVSVMARDTGGSLNGGTNQSAPQTFTLTVMAVPMGSEDALVADRGPLGAPGQLILVRTNGSQTILSTNLLDPYGLALAANGDVIVADLDDAANDPVLKRGAIYRLDRLTLNQTTISAGGEFVEPFAVAIAADGNLLVADALASAGAGAVFRVEAATGSQTALSTGFATLSGLALAPDGTIFATELGAGGADRPKVIEIDPLTGGQAVISEGGHLIRPLGLAVDSATGDLIVVERNSKKLVRVTRNNGGQAIITSSGLLEAPSDVTLLANGDFLITDEGEASLPRILRIQPDGTQSVWSVGGRFDTPRGLVVLP